MSIRLLFVLFSLVAFAQVFVANCHGDHDHDHEHDHDEEVEDEDTDVVVLGDGDFDEVLQKNQYVFVEFYAPWCGHCKRLEPEYEIVASELKESGVVVAKVDATINTAVGEKYGVRGYPTLKLFRSGTPIDYEGGRTAADLIQWIKKKTGPPSLHITTTEALEAIIAQTGTKIVTFISSGHLAVWESLAGGGKVEEFALAHVTDESLYGTYKAGSVVILKTGEETLVYEGVYDEEGITKWILAEGFPLVDELAQKIWMRSAATASPLLAIFVNALDDESNSMIREIATALKGKVLTSHSTTASLAERWGTSGKKFPTAILVKWKGNEPKMTIFNEETETFTVESALAFVEAASNGEYQGFKKSEPIPENNDGPVVVLVGKNFESIVFDQEKDVFVEFYAPWCGHCKNLAPIWDELGQSFTDTPTVVIAKVDATANTLPENIEVQGFPTLIFYPADNKDGVTYNGDRDVKSLKKFVIDTASRSVEKEEL